MKPWSDVNEGEAELPEPMKWTPTCFCCSRIKGRKISEHSLMVSEVVIDGDGAVLIDIDEG